jgi:hypothetical protein
LEKERPNEMEVAKKTYEKRKKEETKAKILDFSIYFDLIRYSKIEITENFKFSIYFFITYLLNIVLILSILLNTLKYTNNIKYLSR